MNFIRDLDGGFSVIENLEVSGAREGKFGVTIIVAFLKRLPLDALKPENCVPAIG